MTKKQDKELKIHQSREDDVFFGLVRVHEDIIDYFGLKKHSVVKVDIYNDDCKKYITRYLWLRTIEDKDIKQIKRNENSIRDKKKWILIDENTREIFKLKKFNPNEIERKNFNFDNSHFWGKFFYCKNHSNPIIRYPFKIAVYIACISLILGLFSLFSNIMNSEAIFYGISITILIIAILLLIILINEW